MVCLWGVWVCVGRVGGCGCVGACVAGCGLRCGCWRVCVVGCVGVCGVGVGAVG